MVFWLWVIAAILSFVLVLLVIKIFLLRRSALRLKEGLAYRLEHETNTLLDIPSRDGAMRDLASCLNSQLILLREERWRFQQGDQALREAVTHISHDLRTPPDGDLWISGSFGNHRRSSGNPAISLANPREGRSHDRSHRAELFRYLILPSRARLDPSRHGSWTGLETLSCPFMVPSIKRTFSRRSTCRTLVSYVRWILPV